MQKFKTPNMATLTLKYNPRNVAVTKMLNAVTRMKGVERIYPEDELTLKEMKLAEKFIPPVMGNYSVETMKDAIFRSRDDIISARTVTVEEMKAKHPRV